MILAFGILGSSAQYKILLALEGSIYLDSINKEVPPQA